MAVTTKSRDLRMAFLLDADALRRLTRLLKENVLDDMKDTEISERVRKEIFYTVDHSDGTSVSTESIDEVLNLPNSNRRKITSVTLETPPRFLPIRASIRLRNASYDPVNYNLRGDYEKVITLADRLEDHLLGLRQWYAPLARVDLFKVLPVVVSIVTLALAILFVGDLLYSGLNLKGSFKGSDDEPNAAVVGTLLLAFSLPFLLLVLGPLVKRLFPLATFAIGQGSDRHKRLSSLRYVFLTGVVLAFVVGVLVNYVS